MIQRAENKWLFPERSLLTAFITKTENNFFSTELCDLVLFESVVPAWVFKNILYVSLSFTSPEMKCPTENAP